MRDQCLDQQQHSSQILVQQALRSHVESVHEYDDEAPFLVCNLDHVAQQYHKWTYMMPGTIPFYAVKCNPDVAIIEQLATLGANFDCASQSEVKLVLQQGIGPDRIIFAHPCKSNSCLGYAKDRGVSQMTFDNAAELHKIAKIFPEAELYLRILADDETAMFRLGEKFGASPDESNELIEMAMTLGLNLVGISFHVGSGANNPDSFHAAIEEAHRAWSYASELGFELHTLDIGGGFSQETLALMAPAVEEALDSYFGGMPIRVIAEPGRYFAEGAYTVACQVVSKRSGGRPEKRDAMGHRDLLYVNDGIYGDFSAVVFEKAAPVPRVLRAGTEYFPEQCHADNDVCLQHYEVFGPTCDSLDCIRKSCMLGATVEIGDWLYFPNMGAYSTACSTTFNGFSNARKVIYVSNQGWKANRTKHSNHEYDASINLVD